MKYLKMDPSVGIQDDEELVEFILNNYSDIPLKPKSGKILAGLAPGEEISNTSQPITPPASAEKPDPFAKFPKDPSKFWSLKYRVFDDKLYEAIRRVCVVYARVILSHFIYMFMVKKMDKYGAAILNRNKKNTAMINAINAEVEKVYQQHPNYKPCSIESFSRTSYWKKITAKYRDKNAKDLAELMGWKTLNVAIKSIIRNMWRSPFSRLLVPPIKIMLAYAGVPFGVGTICNLAISVDDGKNTIGIGLDFKPSGFRISSLVLFTWSSDRRLIQTKMTPPPYSTYRISKTYAKETIDKYKNVELDQFKKEMSKYHGKE